MQRSAIELVRTAVILPVDTFIDYYDLLHVQSDAPAPVIKASYRAMMQKLNHHPDRGGDVGFAQLLNDASKTLCDPDTRALYDALRLQHQQTVRPRRTGETRNKTDSGWGEPGGTPGDVDSETARDAENVRNTQSREGKSTDNPDHSSAVATYQTALSAGSHCLFCRAPYSLLSSDPYAAAGYSHPARCRTCNGARTPIEQQPRSSSEELRSMRRQHHNSSVQLWRQWPSTDTDTVQLYDFSPEGCALLCNPSLQVSQTIMLESHLFNAICTVRHCKPKDSTHYIIGLEFLTLDMVAPPGALLNATA